MKKQKPPADAEIQLINDVAATIAAYEIGIVLERATLATKKRYREVARRALFAVKVLP